MVFMEGASSRGFDSDEAERCSPVESYNPNDFTDDELSRSMDLCIGEDDKTMEQSGDDELSRSMDLCIGEDDKTMEQSGGNLTPPDVIEPNVGLEFDSRDEAREFYVTYGRRTGFTVRIHHNRRSRINNMVIGQDFVCSKEGFRENKYVHRKDRVLPPPPITREGCPAMLRVALRDGVKWVVTKFIKDHNHSLMSPSKVPWRGSGKHLISEDEKDRRIRELTLELYNERQRCKRQCAAYQEQLNMLLKYVEEHTEHMSRSVENIVQRVRELENENDNDSD